MTDKDIKELTAWTRVVEFYDISDDGIGSLMAMFKIRDENERMVRLYREMTIDDAKRLITPIVDKLAMPCEDWRDDWDDPESGFGVDFRWDDSRDAIRVDCDFRT